MQCLIENKKQVKDNENTCCDGDNVQIMNLLSRETESEYKQANE